jgi:DNA-binding MarR family transcriptional regulator/predicted GNAT family N-acyltransferase
MPDDDVLVDQVRRFNRAVTQRVGALDDRYLARDRPLGEARLLWQVGADHDGCDVRRLRSLLDLDSGYLSRLLRSLEADGLVTVDRADDDKRVRTARLTEAGAKERAVLDERSDALARSLLAPLSLSRQERLVAAMVEVERLLTAALVEVEPVDPAHRHARHCLQEYYAELDRRFDGGFDLEQSVAVALDDIRPPTGGFLLASLRGEPVGCGALRTPGEGLGEIKRMWVDPSARGLGVGRRLLTELEDRARASGCRRVRLDTNGVLVEAIAMYRSTGYREVEPFNDDPYAQLYFEKEL